MSASRTMDWTEEGRRIGATLDAFHAVVVVGTDPIATAQVALGIARVQAVGRRVALGDLLGDAEPLQSLVAVDDPHGLVDSFVYGVSLNKVARQVPGAGELFIMPTGTGPVDYQELFSSTRWRRLISGFREVGALLIIAAPADAPNVHTLVAASDGVVIVGDVVPPDVSVAQSLAWVRARRGAAARTTDDVDAAHPSNDAAPVARTAPVAARSNARKLASIVVGLVILALLSWFGSRSYVAGRASREAARADSVSRAQEERVRADSIARVRRDSVARDSAGRVGAGTQLDSFPSLVPANLADSANAASYAVLLAKYNTKSGVILDLNGRFDRVPATTFGVESPTRFFVLVAGAFQTRAGADSLLTQLRARRSLAAGFGSVAPYPLAFLVDSSVRAQEVPARVARYAARGQPVYALRQPNGTARLYFGAYASPEQAALAVPQVREAGLAPTLVYRIGRVF
ncbi:MAG: hypothetical protein ABI601_19375 [bacterium]